MSKRLLIWDENWADEFDVYGFEFVDGVAVDTVIKVLERVEDGDPVSDEYYFGTNEAVDLDSDTVLDTLKNASEPSEEELAVIIKYLGNGGGEGFFGRICSRILDYDPEDDEEEPILTDEEREIIEKYAW